MKLLQILFLICLLSACAKTTDTIPYFSQPGGLPTPDPAPAPDQGLSLMVDDARYLFPVTQVVYTTFRTFNNDRNTLLQRPTAHTIQLNAADSLRYVFFLLNLKLVDYYPTNFVCDKIWRRYGPSFTGFGGMDYLSEPYYGDFSYTDTSGAYTGQLIFTFTTMDSVKAVGRFFGNVRNSLSGKQYYLQGDFNKRN